MSAHTPRPERHSIPLLNLETLRTLGDGTRARSGAWALACRARRHLGVHGCHGARRSPTLSLPHSPSTTSWAAVDRQRAGGGAGDEFKAREKVERQTLEPSLYVCLTVWLYRQNWGRGVEVLGSSIEVPKCYHKLYSCNHNVDFSSTREFGKSTAPVVQLVRASVLWVEGRGFEPP